MAATTMSSLLGLAPKADTDDGDPHDRINLQLRHLHQRIVLREDLAPQQCHRDERGAIKLGRQRGKEQLTIQQFTTMQVADI